MEKFVGYEHGEDYYKQIIEIEGGTENLAAFIATRKFPSEYTITDGFDNLVLNTNGKMVLSCPDEQFLRDELLPILVPYQLGLEPIPDLKVIKQESMEIPQPEEESELEM